MLYIINEHRLIKIKRIFLFAYALFFIFNIINGMGLISMMGNGILFFIDSLENMFRIDQDFFMLGCEDFNTDAPTDRSQGFIFFSSSTSSASGSSTSTASGSNNNIFTTENFEDTGVVPHFVKKIVAEICRPGTGGKTLAYFFNHHPKYTQGDQFVPQLTREQFGCPPVGQKLFASDLAKPEIVKANFANNH